MRKRGADFWSEFEFYLSDLVVGCVLDVVLVSLMAPTVAVTAKRARAGRESRCCAALACCCLGSCGNGCTTHG